MIFENSVPKANFGQNIRDSPNGSLTADSRSLQTATLNVGIVSPPTVCFYYPSKCIKYNLYYHRTNVLMYEDTIAILRHKVLLPYENQKVFT